MRLTVCHPAALSRVALDERGRWAYTDSDLYDFAVIEKMLGQDKSLCSARELQRIVFEIRSDFSAWVDRNLSDATMDEEILTPLSRNPLHDLFLQLVWLRILGEAFRLDDDSIVVVTRSRGMAEVLCKHGRGLGAAIQVLGKGYYAASAAHRRLRLLAKFAYLIIQAAGRMLLSRLLLGQDYRDRIRSSGVKILVDTYLYAGDVATTGEVNHRYFPGLVDWYRSQGQVAAYLPTLYRVGWRALASLYRGYRTSSVLFVPAELYLSCRDLLSAAVTCLRGMMRSSRLIEPVWHGVEVDPLIVDSRLHGAVEGLSGLLTNKVPRRLQEARLQPDCLLDWFENQPVDRGLALSMRRYLPACRHVAMRQNSFYSGWLALFVTDREVKQGVVPEEHWVCGSAWLRPASEFDHAGRYRVVPALRYGYLHIMEKPVAEGNDLLILLTVSVAESGAMLRWIEEQMEELFKLFSRIRIKPHPTNSREVLRRSVSGLSKLWENGDVVWEAQPISELLPKARIVFSAGSSASLEAIAVGVPVLHAGRSAGVDLNPLEQVDERLWCAVFSAEEFREAVAAWSPSHPLPRAERIALGRQVSQACFEPASEESMKLFSLNRSQSGSTRSAL